MTVQELVIALEKEEFTREDFKVMIPVEKEGDIDEVDMYEVRNLTWDVAEKRVLLEW